MLAGTLELIIGEEAYRLMEGDSVLFRSPPAHGYRNVGDKVARVLWVNTPPPF